MGRSYLVYAYGPEGFETDICGRTAALERAGDDLAALGPPRVTFVRVPTASRLGALLALVGVSAAFLAGVVAGRAWERRRQATSFDFLDPPTFEAPQA